MTIKRKKTQMFIAYILTFLCVFAMVPLSTYAQETVMEPESIEKSIPQLSINTNGEQTYTTKLTNAEIEQNLDKQIETEINNIISEGRGEGIFLMASSRPTYTTTHGATKEVKAPYKKVAGQPSGGVQFSTGGSIFVDWSGGTSFSFSYSFPTPYGSIGLSATPGKKVSQAKGVQVNIPASKTQHYIVYMANTYKCKPYIVYEVTNGKKSVYYKGTSKVWYQSSFDVRKNN